VVVTAARIGDNVTVTLGAATVRLSAVLGERPLDAPVTVMEVVVRLAELSALNVRTLVVLVFCGLNDAETPEGRPDAARATLPLNPCCGTTFTAAVTIPP